MNQASILKHIEAAQCVEDLPLILGVALFDEANNQCVVGEPFKRHNDLYNELSLHGLSQEVDYDEGFFTENYGFINRHNAFVLARMNGQYKREVTPTSYNGEELFSEDLW